MSESPTEYYLLPSNPNTGHGHVRPRPDGVKARCGGPGICSECSREKARAEQREAPSPAPPAAGTCERHGRFVGTCEKCQSNDLAYAWTFDAAPPANPGGTTYTTLDEVPTHQTVLNEIHRRPNPNWLLVEEYVVRLRATVVSLMERRDSLTDDIATLMAHNDAQAAQLAALREDSARLDALERWCSVVGTEVTQRRWYMVVHGSIGQTFREAIDTDYRGGSTRSGLAPADGGSK